SKCQIFAKNNLQKDEYDLFLKMYEIVEASVMKPDLLVYLYLGVDRLQENIRNRGRSYEQQISDEYLENIQKQYIEFIRQHKDLRVLIIDTGKLDFVNDKNDFIYIESLIRKEYPAGITRIEAKSEISG
ncbi:MAG: deoxynucleoside kinase, partial [Crocinitomicaceae bacterium]|nr:deoxynucleoside kinase [Crocinitomicaceae bacterium]